MTTEKCNCCEEEFDVESMMPVDEYGTDYICHECMRDREEECPRCGGRGCSYCYCTEW